MHELLIVGAGGFGRETLEAVRACNGVQPTWNPLGFLDDDETLRGRRIDGLEVLGACDIANLHPGTQVVLTPGSPSNFSIKRALARRLGLANTRYATVVHPAASLARSTRIGPGSVVLAGVVATADVEIGAHVGIMPGVVLTHDDIVGDFATLGANVCLAGRVVVEEGAYIGAGALVREDLTVGSWSLVGMGAVVTRDVPALQTWAGVPARFLRSMEAPQHLKAVRS